jgi:hypothetical protein
LIPNKGQIKIYVERKISDEEISGIIHLKKWKTLRIDQTSQN